MSATTLPLESPKSSTSESNGGDKEAIRLAISLGARLNRDYIVMNALATIVAGYGLLADSTAVVIGAMIIAMLLGPIMALALSLVDGDTGLLRRALVAELTGAILVLAIGFLLGKIHSEIPLTSEILSRTKPNLLDLMVALSGGAAGAYATVSPRLTVGLVGVAISTALVPPLASCGICLAHGQKELATGAFLLFVTNLVAIQCASSVVLFLFGYYKRQQVKGSQRAYLSRLVADALLFCALAVFLFFRLSTAIAQESFEAATKKALQKGLDDIRGSYLSDTRFRSAKDSEIVVAVVQVPNSITPQQTAKIEALLPSKGRKKTLLYIRSLLTKEVTKQGYLNVISPKSHPADDLEDPKAEASDSDGQ